MFSEFVADTETETSILRREDYVMGKFEFGRWNLSMGIPECLTLYSMDGDRRFASLRI